MSTTRPQAAMPINLTPGAPTPLSQMVAVRRSVKEFRSEPLSIEHLGGALAHTARRGDARPYASARGEHLITLTLVAGQVEGLRPGAYRYAPSDHTLHPVERGDHRADLAAGTVDARWLATCPVIVLLSADNRRAEGSFAEFGAGRGERFAWLEAGLIAQNLYLWAAATGLGTVFIGGFHASAMADIATRLLPSGTELLGLMPLGHPVSGTAASAHRGSPPTPHPGPPVPR